MNVPDVARQVLVDMWEYGRIVLIVGFVAIVWGIFLGRSEDENERPPLQLGLLLIGVGLVGGFALFSFLNVESSNLAILIRARPAWGGFTGFIVLVSALVTVMMAAKLFMARRSEASISIRPEGERPSRSVLPRIKVSLIMLLSLILISFAWLWKIAF